MKLSDTNKAVYIDLKTSQIRIEILSEKLLKKFLGGRGINNYFLSKLTDAGTQGLAEENVLIIGTGLLTGAKSNCFTRTTVTAKSPETGLLGDANIGGGFGVNLRLNGYGFIIIFNSAPGPSIVVIDGDDIQIKLADHLWGLDTKQVQDRLKDEIGGNEALCIGPAGENRVVFSCIINGLKNAAARCGMGAVMGSKNLKAVVVTDKNVTLEYFDRKKFYDVLKKLNKELLNDPMMNRIRNFGSNHLFKIITEYIGMARIKNGSSVTFDSAYKLNHKAVEKYVKKRGGCKNCIIQCQHHYQYEDIKNQGPEYGVVGHLGPVLGIENIEDVLYLNDYINRLGIDASSLANLIALLIELFDRKIIDNNFVEYINWRWGSLELVKDLIDKIVNRTGIGALLADGHNRLLEELPSGVKKYFCSCKGLFQSDPVDLRHIPSYALANSLSSRGSDHLRGRPIWVSMDYKKQDLERVYGEKISTTMRSYKDGGKLVWWWENYLLTFDLLGLCKFIGLNYPYPGLSSKLFVDLIYFAHGIKLAEEDLKEICERVISLERKYICDCGIDRKDDYPSEKYFLPIVESGLYGDEVIDTKLDRKSYDDMLDEYYEKRGWTVNGLVSKETIKKLNIAPDQGAVV